VSIVCAFVPSYKVAVARVHEPRLRERPLIVADRHERGHAIDLDAQAFALGARVGMTLVQASACAREATIVVDDPGRDRALWERALDALDAASPLVEDAAEGVAFLEMRGIEGSPERRLAAVREALRCDAELSALPFQAAFAANKFVARAAAGVRDACVVAAGREREFVAPLSLHVLELGMETIERLRLLGVRTLGALAALPHGPFVRRFGPEGALWHAHASGNDGAPLVPRPRALVIERTLYGEGTAEREDQLLFALRALVARVAEDLAYAGKRCGALRLSLECEDGETLDLPMRLAQPTAQSATMFDLLRARLEGQVLGSPVSGLKLGAERLEEGGSELSFFAGNDPDPEVVAIALARLNATLGPQSALRARVAAGNRYEARVAFEPFTVERIHRRPQAACSAPPAPPGATGTLAYRLLAPRRVDVRLARGRPAFVGSRAVRDVAGPWRVDEAWWAEALDSGLRPIASDAYDVLLDDGTLCRIVHERGAWYISGVYD
jgi:protein ImuB